MSTTQTNPMATLADPPRVEDMTDETILLRYRKTGERDLFAELVRRYEGALLVRQHDRLWQLGSKCVGEIDRCAETADSGKVKKGSFELNRCAAVV